MRAVIDTNVIVSGMLNGAGTPGKIVDAVLRGEILVVHSDLILNEYREVLHRGKFAFNLAEIRVFLDAAESDGEYVAMFASTIPLPDPKDRPFLDAALYAACPVVTGNGKHFPATSGVKILTPAEALALL